MAAKQQPAWLHVAISWGASVVIIGALAKIIHWGGSYANILIAVGLGVEAFLFFIMGFFPPEKELPWEKVYPELNPDFKGELPKATVRAQAPSSTGFSNTAALDKMLSDAKVGPELIESLGNNLRTFGDKVSAISNVSDVAMASQEFTGKIKSAGQSFDQLNAAFSQATAQLAAMGESNMDTRAYHEQVNQLAKNLTALNAVYELELQDSSTHLKSMNQFYQNLASTMQNFNESMEDSRQFKEEVGKLAKNLASLNSIYGNMLTAMNQPRV